MKKLQISKRVLIVSGIWLLTVLSFITTGNVFAKYVYTHEYDPTPVTAKAFYFESDYLTTQSNQEYKLNSTTNSISFNLYNFNYDVCPDPDCPSCEYVTQVDCNYTINVTAYNKATSTYDQNFTVEVKVGDTVKASPDTAPANKKTVQTVTIGGMEPNHDYTVTVTATGGYQKTLSATFSVAKLDNGFFMNVDTSNDEFVILTVWALGDAFVGDVTITGPAGLIPDAKDSLLKTVNNYKEVEVEGGEYQYRYVEFSFKDTINFGTSYPARSYRFFKDENYKGESFTVTLTVGGDTFSAEKSDEIP